MVMYKYRGRSVCRDSGAHADSFRGAVAGKTSASKAGAQKTYSPICCHCEESIKVDDEAIYDHEIASLRSQRQQNDS